MRITASVMRQYWQCRVERLLAAGEMPMSYDEYAEIARRLLGIEIVDDQVDDQVVERANVPSSDYPELILDSVTGTKWLLGNYNGAPCYRLISKSLVTKSPTFFYSARGRLKPHFLEIRP